MKPGDLVTIHALNATFNIPIAFIDVYETVDGLRGSQWKWKPGELGVLVKRPDALRLVQVLHGGRVGWVNEEYLRVVNETR